MSNRGVLRPREAARKRRIALWRQVAEFSEARRLAAERSDCAGEHCIKVASWIVVARVAAGLVRPDDSFVVVDANAVGELARAETLFQEGFNELPDQLQFGPDRVFCLIYGTGIAYNQGDSKEAMARALTAQRIVHDSLRRDARQRT